jgi:hypothetical protein
MKLTNFFQNFFFVQQISALQIFTIFLKKYDFVISNKVLEQSWRFGTASFVFSGSFHRNADIFMKKSL